MQTPGTLVTSCYLTFYKYGQYVRISSILRYRYTNSFHFSVL